MSDDKTMKQLARDVLLMANDVRMPDTFWATDSRIKRAREVLGWTTNQARDWARLITEEDKEDRDMRDGESNYGN